MPMDSVMKTDRTRWSSNENDLETVDDDDVRFLMYYLARARGVSERNVR